MSDLISKQALLKHIEKIRQKAQMMDDIRRASILMNGMYLCEEAVMNQPSAQPEIVRCKDCRYYSDDDEYEHWCNGFGCPARLTTPDDFCSRAERRTDV